MDYEPSDAFFARNEEIADYEEMLRDEKISFKSIKNRK